jgi:hypothetical protein
MNRNAMILLGLLVLLILVGGTVTTMQSWSVERAVAVATPTPAEADIVHNFAQEIIAFTPPEGYVPSFGVNVAGTRAVGYDPGDELSILIWLHQPDWATRPDAAIADEAWAWLDREYNISPENLQLVEERTLTTGNGQTQTVTISDGVNADGEAYRLLQAVVAGEEGPLFLVFEEPLARWDDARAAALIASIHDVD